MLLKNRILLDSADDNGSPSGYGAEAATTTTTTETTQTQGDTGNGTQVDATKTGASDTTSATDDKSKQASEDVTGYTKDESKGDTTEKVVTEDKPLELDLKELKEEEVADIRELAKSLNLTKEQAQGLVDKRKADNDSRVKTIEAVKAKEAEVYTKWTSELKADADFGGQNFNHSVHTVNKLIREELPELGKLLTKGNKRLSPGLMKDLNRLGRKVYGETTFEQGDGAGGSKKEWNPTDFYGTKK